MKLRHVRAVAVFGVVVLALTGARRHHGGGCSGDHDSSSSGYSSSHHHHYDDDDDDDYDDDGGYASGDGSATASPASGTGEPTTDLTITSCLYEEQRGIVATVHADNRSSTAYSYTFTVTFKDPAGTDVQTLNSTMPAVDGGGTDAQDVVADRYTPGGDDTTQVHCVLSDTLGTASSY